MALSGVLSPSSEVVGLGRLLFVKTGSAMEQALVLSSFGLEVLRIAEI